jgi:hypothetical protein
VKSKIGIAWACWYNLNICLLQSLPEHMTKQCAEPRALCAVVGRVMLDATTVKRAPRPKSSLACCTAPCPA